MRRLTSVVFFMLCSISLEVNSIQQQLEGDDLWRIIYQLMAFAAGTAALLAFFGMGDKDGS